MHKIENNSLRKEEMSYGGDTWYIGRIFEELQSYACILGAIIFFRRGSQILKKLA